MLVNFSCSCRSACPTFVPTAGFVTALVCQDTSAVLHCPEGSVINVKSAFYGRRNADVCRQLEGSEGGCTVTQKHKMGEKKINISFLE